MKAPTLKEELKDLLAKQKIIPVVGAGVSYATAGLPGWKGLLENGLEYAAHRGIPTSEEAAEIQQHLDKNELLPAATLLKKLMNAPGRPFSSWLDKMFSDVRETSTELRESIEGLNAPFIATTNYDRLLSNSHLYSITYDWTEGELTRRGIDKQIHFILHMHGVYDKPSTVILDTEDYRKIGADDPYRYVLNSVWMNYSMLFIGCSKDGMLDEDFKLAIIHFNKCFAHSTHTHYILLRDSEADNTTIRRFLGEYGIQIVKFGNDHAGLPDYIHSLNPNAGAVVESYTRLKEQLNGKIERLINRTPAGTSLEEGAARSVISREEILNHSRITALREILEKRQREAKDKREEFRRHQEIVKAIFKPGELQKLVDLWSKHQLDPEPLLDTEFIDTAVLAHELLLSFPGETLMAIYRKNAGFIHNYWFDGYLSIFVHEYKNRLKLPKEYEQLLIKDDRYLFENLKRIIDSLRGVLEVDPGAVFPNIPTTDKLLKQQVQSYALCVLSNELSIRSLDNLNEKLASIGSETNLQFSEVVKINKGSILCGYNRDFAFYWDPRTDTVMTPFFNSSSANGIKLMRNCNDEEGNLFTRLIEGQKTMHFRNFFPFTDTIPAAVQLRFENDPDLDRFAIPEEQRLWEMLLALPGVGAYIQVGLEKRKEVYKAFGSHWRSGALKAARKEKIQIREKSFICIRILLDLVGRDSLLLYFDCNDTSRVAGFHFVKNRICFAYRMIEHLDKILLAIGYLSQGDEPYPLLEWLSLSQGKDYFTFINKGEAIPNPGNINDILGIEHIKETPGIVAFDSKAGGYILNIETNEFKKFILGEWSEVQIIDIIPYTNSPI